MGLPETLFTQFRHRKAPSIFLSAVSGSSLFCPAGILPQDRVATAQSAPKIEIPFQLSNNNLMIVKVTVASQRNVNMIVETGTNPSLITKTLADKLRLPRDPAAIKTLNGTIRTESVVLPAFDFGPLHSVALRVMVQGLSFLEQDLGISLGGIIGLDILINGSFTIDYGKKSIAFGAVPAELKTVPFAATAPSLTVQARIDGQKVRLLLDSGTRGVLLYRNRLTAMPITSHLDRRASISTGSGSSRLSGLRTRVSIGEEDLGTREIAIADVDSNFGDEFDGLMGFAKMGFHRVAFDFQNGRFGWD
jgi:predicted aspartyl protease